MICDKSFYHTVDVEYVDPENGYVICETIFRIHPATGFAESDWDSQDYAEIEETTVFLEGVPVNYIKVPDQVLYNALKEDVRSNIITDCFNCEGL